MDKAPECYYFHGTGYSSNGELPTFREDASVMKDRFEIGKTYQIEILEYDVNPDDSDQIYKKDFIEGTVSNIHWWDMCVRVYFDNDTMLEIIKDDFKWGWWTYDCLGNVTELNSIREVE